MKKIRGVFIGLMVITALIGMVMTGNGLAEENSFACAPKIILDADTAGKVMLEDFSCFFKKWKGADELHFKVGIKNISDTPQRYRVNIFLENGKGVGGLIPRKTAKGLVQPEASASFTYPVRGMNQKPKGTTLIIKTMAP
jgi:hypothetical protein